MNPLLENPVCNCAYRDEFFTALEKVCKSQAKKHGLKDVREITYTLSQLVTFYLYLTGAEKEMIKEFMGTAVDSLELRKVEA